MLLQQILLENFRNFSQDTFNFNPCLTVIFGDNSKGKTNLLEAIHFVTNGSGFRETKEIELIKFEEKSATVDARFGDDKENLSYKIILDNRKTTIQKNFFINKARKTFYSFRRETDLTVLFTPQQIEIITDSPDIRRKYFDKFICLYNLEYKKKLVNYEAALRKRNKLLEIINNIDRLKEELTFWDQYLEEQAVYITNERQSYVDFLNSHPTLDHKNFNIQYLKSELTKKRLEENLDKELRFRRTLIGPQKDDFHIFLAGRDLHFFGSRSEQRLAIFWLKVNEINYFEKNFQKKPIILLDDVFSELDDDNRKLVLNLIKKYQTILTTTDQQLTKFPHIPTSIIKL